MKIFFNVTNELSYGGLQVALSILRHWGSMSDMAQLILCTLENHKILDSLGDSTTLVVEKIPCRMSAVKTRRRMQKMMDRLVEKYQPNTLFTDGEWEHESSVWHSTEFLQKQ